MTTTPQVLPPSATDTTAPPAACACQGCDAHSAGAARSGTTRRRALQVAGAGAGAAFLAACGSSASTAASSSPAAAASSSATGSAAVTSAASSAAPSSSAAATTAASSAASSAATSAASGSAAPVAGIVALADVPVGGSVSANAPDGSPIIIAQPTAGTAVAFSAICTHAGCTVVPASGVELDCPCHGSVFDASTGAATKGPAKEALPAFAVKVESGQVVAG